MTAYAAYLLKKEFKNVEEVTQDNLKDWVLTMQLKHGGDFLGHLTGRELKRFAELHGIKIIKG